MSFLNFVVAFIVLLQLVQSIPQRYRHIWKFDNGEYDLMSGNFTLPQTLQKNTNYPTVKEKVLQQPIDHFNSHEVNSFNQRYFADETYWSRKPNAPVFLCVGGEGPPLDKSVLVSSVHCNDMVELAAKHGALLLALEHRYYGTSMPSVGDYSTNNLQWLSTEQALEDLAAFHASTVASYGLLPSNKWVTWGGSYPGMLAAMARLRFPHLFHACVSSSSPLQAVVDFPGYNNVVAESLANPAVGGSADCLGVVVDGHAQIGELLKTSAGRRQLETQFNICDAGSLDNPLNQEQFAGDGVLYIPAQSNDPSCTGANCNIAKICTTLLAADKSVSALQRLADYSHSAACTSVSYANMLTALSNPKNPTRSWLYQTCSEWGFYQTCETGSQCPYTRGLHGLSVDLDICQQAFGLDEEHVRKAIDATNTRYGGATNFQASRVLFPNGDVDPWKAGGVAVSPPGSVEEPTLLVLGASHHFWTHPTLPTDSKEVVAAREVIWKQVDEWLLQ